MSFTYDISNNIGKVRFLIGDTLSTDALIENDTEIQFCLDQVGDIYRAGALAARAGAAKLLRELSVDQGRYGWKLDREAQADRLLKLADQLEAKALTVGGVTPFAGGISISDKQSREQNTDRVQPGITVNTSRAPGTVILDPTISNWPN